MDYEPVALLALLRVLRDPRIMRHILGDEEYERREARKKARKRKEAMSWAEKRIERMEKNKRKADYEREWRARKRAERSLRYERGEMRDEVTPGKRAGTKETGRRTLRRADRAMEGK